MIDPVQLPLLLKAIDFVFEEGRKILDERREQRKLNNASSKNESPDQKEAAEPTQEVTLVVPEEREEIKQELLTSKIDELLWQNHEIEIQHLVKLLETYSRNYYLAKEQYAQWGNALVPPIIVHNLRDAETSIEETLKQLENVLSKVYKKEIHLIR